MVDVHRASPPAELAPARTQRAAYVVARRAAVARTCGGDGEGEALARHAAVEHALFTTLPRALLRARCINEEQLATLCLFSESYVVKPARSACQFAWHQDAAEQLAMCGAAVEERTAPYISLWCPLDDCTLRNGTLVVRPGLEVRSWRASGHAACGALS